MLAACQIPWSWSATHGAAIVLGPDSVAHELLQNQCCYYPHKTTHTVCWRPDRFPGEGGPTQDAADVTEPDQCYKVLRDLVQRALLTLCNHWLQLLLVCSSTCKSIAERFFATLNPTPSAGCLPGAGVMPAYTRMRGLHLA